MQILEDLQKVLHHQGWPRDDYEIDLERMMNSCPSHIKNNSQELQKWLQDQYNNIVNNLKNIKPDSDIVHFNDVKRNLGGSNANSRSLDVRAVNEIVDTQVLNGAKQMGIFSNRISGNTETWGTVQFRIFCSGIASCQRGSKRLVEEIARLWLRVNGIQAVPKFKHNTIDWNSEEQRMNVKLLEEKFYAIAVMMNWIKNDEAAQAPQNPIPQSWIPQGSMPQYPMRPYPQILPNPPIPPCPPSGKKRNYVPLIIFTIIVGLIMLGIAALFAFQVVNDINDTNDNTSNVLENSNINDENDLYAEDNSNDDTVCITLPVQVYQYLHPAEQQHIAAPDASGRNNNQEH
jgi:hypothetical protein